MQNLKIQIINENVQKIIIIFFFYLREYKMNCAYELIQSIKLSVQ